MHELPSGNYPDSLHERPYVGLFIPGRPALLDTLPSFDQQRAQNYFDLIVAASVRICKQHQLGTAEIIPYRRGKFHPFLGNSAICTVAEERDATLLIGQLPASREAIY